MTLKTLVALTGPIDAGTAFDLALRAILDAAGEPEKYASARYRTLSHHRRITYRTVPNQDLPALTDATALEDGTQLDLPIHLEDALAGWTLAEQTCSALVSWDTMLGYRGPIWGGTDLLHAAAIVLLCDSLPTDVDLHWKDEATGTWHHRWTGIRELTASVLPSRAIASHIRATHHKEPRS